MIEKMKWRRNQQQQHQQEQEERRKQEGKKNEKKNKKHTSSFSFSSWLAKLKPKRSIATVAAARDAVFAPPPSPRPPDPSPRSAHLFFSPVARFPPPVPHRLSVWDDAGGLRPRIAPVRARRRSARHHSVGDLELTLGHIIPFSRRWAESDSGTDASGCDLGHGRRPPRPRRRRSARTTAGYASDQRADPDARDGLPRRSFTGKIRHRAKVRVRSPRTAAVRAEEVERMRAASRRKREEEVERRGLERFAVVKCSSDPQRDFRESMVEMIWEKRLGRPAEMESLLACYLALNSAEHHDVIVKVFRQVWFELNLERLAHESNRRR
ncbi:hypothetical protein MUK42_05955 [Musa troglodytarum]|uniref:Transcription repressor n=3 Tax=Musa troglodytarum TaxID=320322 RepID=A0A9E7H7Z0_9LILI|nr:hypothetical protein MUK42_05955 [Musa troglodytarum]